MGCYAKLGLESSLSTPLFLPASNCSPRDRQDSENERRHTILVRFYAPAFPLAFSPCFIVINPLVLRSSADSFPIPKRRTPNQEAFGSFWPPASLASWDSSDFSLRSTTSTPLRSVSCLGLPFPAMEFSSSPPASRRRLNLDDEDDELSIVQQSSYFTQPTQVVERPASRLPPVANSSPRSIVEVPASSPFRPQSLQQRGSRIANLMAPAGTAFRAPARQVLPIQKTAPKREFIMISDDELDAPIYAGGDSSDDDEQLSRGDIRPSSFQPKEPEMSNGTSGAQLPGGRTVNSLPGTLFL